jgi:hypothetical protein
VSVVGHGTARSLHVTVRVSTRARAQLQLLQRGFERVQKLFSLHAGANSFRLALPSSLKAGRYRLALAIRAGQLHRTATARVAVTP